MGTKWSQHRRKNSSTLSVKSKKRSPSAETSQVSADAAFPGCAVQRKSCKPQHEFLTDDEQTALVKSWEVIKSSDLQLIGIKVLTRIFEIEPETKQTFPNFRNLTLGELLENPKFKSHAIRFMRAVEVTMENLNALDVIIIPNLKHLGQLHTDISGFKLSYLKAVEIAMDETWETIHEGKPIVVKGYKCRTTPTTPTTPTSNNNNNNNYDIDDQIYSGISTTTGVYDQLTRCAWMKIFHLITSKIMEGYHEGVEVKLAKEMSKVKKEGTPSGSPKEVNVPHTQQHHQQQLEKTNQQVGSVVLASLQCHSNRRHDNGNQGRCVVGDDGDDDDDDDIPVVQSSGGPLSKDDEKSQGNHHRQQQQYHHHHQQQHHQQHHYQPHKINNGDLTQKSEVTCIKRNNINNNFVKVVPFCPASGNGPI